MSNGNDDDARTPDEIVSLQLRIPEWLREKLTAEAKTNKRSLNSEMTMRLIDSTRSTPVPTDTDLALRLIGMAERLLTNSKG